MLAEIFLLRMGSHLSGVEGIGTRGRSTRFLFMARRELLPSFKHVHDRLCSHATVDLNFLVGRRTGWMNKALETDLTPSL
jgi:hypothetical protein